MGRSNRSRKRRDKMNLIKKARYEIKELARLKKTLGIMDVDGTNEMMQKIGEVATVRTNKELKEEGKSKEEKELEYELEESREKGDRIEVTNEKTGKVHVYNSKTLKDQHGNYPPWFKRRRMPKRLRKKAYSQKKNFKQYWTTTNVPL